MFQCQGQTISPPIKIMADINECFQTAMAYVILSRIVSISQLYLKPFNQKKIYCNEAAKLEAEKIKKNSLNKIVTKWDIAGSVKITSLNIRSLLKHSEDLENDFYLNKSDIICITETWLTEDLLGKFSNFPNQYYVNRKSKGVALLSKIKPRDISKISNHLSSVIVVAFENFTLVNVYRFSENTNIKEFTEQFLKDISKYMTESVVICGDLNIDLIENCNNIFTKSLTDIGFQYLDTGPTHIHGGQIDHVYFKCENQNIFVIFNKLHSIYYSDHDSVTFIINIEES